MSDGISFLLYRVIGYRKKVVISQLRQCFPDWSEEKLQLVAKESYRNLSDIMVESFKTDRLSKEEMMNRFIVRNPEEFNAIAQSNQNILAAGSHFNNWEWGSVASNYFFNSKIYGLYKPVANKLINSFIKKAREDVGTQMIPISGTRNLFASPLETSSTVVFVADQCPSNVVDAIWLDFLGKDTPCLHGLQKYATQTGWPIFLWRVYRMKRGYYEVEVVRLRNDEKQDVVHQYMSLLEEDIRNNPSSWLWTHKRWKRRREEAETQKEKRKLRVIS